MSKCVNRGCPQYDYNCECTGFCDVWMPECNGKCFQCPDIECENHPDQDRGEQYAESIE